MNKLFKKIVVLALVATVSLTSVGCFGSFNLVKKVYAFNDKQEGKWMKEIVFLGLNIIPVYGVAAFVDAYILNLIEFWTGNNPMASNISSDDGTKITFNELKKQVEVSYNDQTFVLVHENGKATVKNAEGTVLAYAISGDNGSMNIIDGNGKVLSTYTEAEVSAMLASK